LHAEIKASMRDEFIDLFKGIFVEQKRDSLARGEFPFGALPVHAPGAAADFGGTVHLGQAFKTIRYCDLSHTVKLTTKPYVIGPMVNCHMSYRTGSIWHMTFDHWPNDIWFCFHYLMT